MGREAGYVDKHDVRFVRHRLQHPAGCEGRPWFDRAAGIGGEAIGEDFLNGGAAFDGGRALGLDPRALGE